MIIVLQCARGAVNFHLLSGSTENSVAFSDADGATSSSSNYRVCDDAIDCHGSHGRKGGLYDLTPVVTR
jgi:hypothetical protein